ncbi:hypothetical protein QQ045_029415 [Rhodiola kirilowii]
MNDPLRGKEDLLAVGRTTKAGEDEEEEAQEDDADKFGDERKRRWNYLSDLIVLMGDDLKLNSYILKKKIFFQLGLESKMKESFLRRRCDDFKSGDYSFGRSFVFV